MMLIPSYLFPGYLSSVLTKPLQLFRFLSSTENEFPSSAHQRLEQLEHTLDLFID